MAMEIIFTEHAEERLIRRKLLKEEIVEAIKFPDKVLKKHDRYYYQKVLERGKVEIVCEKTEKHIKVITLYRL
jgi:CO/xanthine dehydrogenase FAD-binding subunit|tara:strand:+ start:9649 stop:9867 length:219 start_codon:yes stop_codon:yes gene_type:complete